MVIKDNPVIRAFGPDDRQALRRLCEDTAFMGDPVERFLENRELFSDWAASYYTDYEPESIFLAEYQGRVVGYVMGSISQENYQRLFYKRVRPRCLKESWQELFCRPSSRRLFWALAGSFLKGEFRRPDFSRIYPAHLHINVDKAFRGLGIGALLMDRFLAYLAFRKVSGVCLATISARANRFFRNQGFSLLYRRRVTYFDYLGQGEVYLSMYGKMLAR